jgi:Pyridine nucleotide-disulphide oxidoreductase
MPSPSSLLATMRSQHLRTWRGDIVKAAMPRARICAGLDSTLGLILVVLRPGPTKKQARTARVGYGPGSDIRRFGPSALLRLSGNPRHQRIETHRELAVAFERAEVATDPAERTRLLTFVICGAGPTGVELAGAIADLAHFGLSDEFRSIDPSSARIVLVQAGPRVLPTFPEGLSLAAQTSLEKMGIEVRLNSRVEKVEAGRVIVNGEAIPAGTVLWAAGVVASPAARWLGHEPDSAGRLKVSPDLSVPGHPEIFGVGDTVSVAAWNGRRRRASRRRPNKPAPMSPRYSARESTAIRRGRCSVIGIGAVWRRSDARAQWSISAELHSRGWLRGGSGELSIFCWWLDSATAHRYCWAGFGLTRPIRSAFNSSQALPSPRPLLGGPRSRRTDT